MPPQLSGKVPFVKFDCVVKELPSHNQKKKDCMAFKLVGVKGLLVKRPFSPFYLSGETLATISNLPINSNGIWNNK